MSRLSTPFIERVDKFADRCLDVTLALAVKGVPHFVVDQLGRSSTSVGANVAEADEAMTTKDFAKCLATSLKELNETR